MAKKEEAVDLSPRAEKISNEHLDQLQKIVNKINQIQSSVGKIEVQKHNMLHDLAVAQDNISVMQDSLQKTYGSYDVNVVTGEINWPKAKNKPSPPIPPRDGKPSSNNVEKPKKDEK